MLAVGAVASEGMVLFEIADLSSLWVELHLFGAALTVGIALITTILAFVLGATLGFLAATVGGWLDQLLSRPPRNLRKALTDWARKHSVAVS